jgi:hypothetical protein
MLPDLLLLVHRICPSSSSHSRYLSLASGSEGKHEWPKPLRNASALGLLSFVKKFSVHGNPSHKCFSPEQFNRRPCVNFQTDQRPELEIDNLDIPSFIPKIRRYFGHFLPTVRSLALGSPKGSRRQIIFFIGLFQHLQDLTLRDCKLDPRGREPADDLSLIPPFTPPLRGRLVVSVLKMGGLLKDMFACLGGSDSGMFAF